MRREKSSRKKVFSSRDGAKGEGEILGGLREKSVEGYRKITNIRAHKWVKEK